MAHAHAFAFGLGCNGSEAGGREAVGPPDSKKVGFGAIRDLYISIRSIPTPKMVMFGELHAGRSLSPQNLWSNFFFSQHSTYV